MELQFVSTDRTCLEEAIREVQTMELTQEMKVPDGLPDIGRVICAWGQVILRGKQWHADSIGCSAGLMIWVLYVQEDGTDAQVLDTWIPFQMHWELPQGAMEGTIRADCRIRFLDARSVSARRIMVRAGVSVQVEALSPKTFQTYGPESSMQDVELLENMYPLRLVKEAGEKTFLLEETLSLPQGSPEPKKVISYSLRPKITDKKVLANKLVFRGTGNLHLLYQSREGELYAWNEELSFSQFAELDGEYSQEAQADLVTALTSAELELEEDGQIRLKCGLVSQYRITDREMVPMVEDGYSPGRAVELSRESLTLPVLLESRRESIQGEESLAAEGENLIDLWFEPDFPRQQPGQDTIELEIPGTIQALYRDPEGKLQYASQRWTGRRQIQAGENTRLNVNGLDSDVLSGIPDGGKLRIKLELPLVWAAETKQSFPQVTGVTVGEAKAADEDRPSLILRRMGTDRLWDIAKETGSTMAAIRKANALEEDPAPDKLLLIPVL